MRSVAARGADDGESLKVTDGLERGRLQAKPMPKVFGERLVLRESCAAVTHD
ncbi:hypothetical protein BH09PLA1_BH09PLA1_29830 [soil metagenome]